jgi:predicted RNase H-like nuclease (RuvC/YqgF family)
MSTEAENVESVENTESTSEISIEDLQAQVQEYQTQLDDYKSQVDKVNNKNKELIAERRKDQERKKALEEEARAVKEEKLKENENYKDLFEARDQEVAQLREQLEETVSSFKSKEQKALAYKLASQVASGHRAEDLAEFHLRSRIVEDENGEVRFKNEEGKVIYTSADELLEEIRTSDRFQHLIDGPKSSGGDAPGNTSSASKAKPIPKSEFDKMTPRQKIKFQAEGGRFDPNL